jgi:hypothetical protein
MSTPGLHAATEKVIAGIYDPEVEARYPIRSHFIPTDSPRHGEMATRALFAGDPVVLVHPDGHETLLTPERAAGIAGLFLFFAVVLLRFRARNTDEDLVQFPPRTRIEARDSLGLRVAA